MTREEEIQKAIEEEFEDHLFEDEYDYIMQSSKFKKGILWADENPKEGLWDAEKVIKFIHTIFTETISGNVISRTNTTVDEVIKDLRKAMEE